MQCAGGFGKPGQIGCASFRRFGQRLGRCEPTSLTHHGNEQRHFPRELGQVARVEPDARRARQA